MGSPPKNERLVERLSRALLNGKFSPHKWFNAELITPELIQSRSYTDAATDLAAAFALGSDGPAVVIADATWRHDYDGTHKYDHLHQDGTTVAHEADEGCPEISLRAAMLADFPGPYSVPTFVISGTDGRAYDVPEAAIATIEKVTKLVVTRAVQVAFDETVRMYVRLPEEGADASDVHTADAINAARGRVLAVLGAADAPTAIDEAINVLRRAGYIVHTNEGECYAVIAKRPDQGDPYPELRREVEAERAQAERRA